VPTKSEELRLKSERRKVKSGVNKGFRGWGSKNPPLLKEERGIFMERNYKFRSAV
jgi:hypothetical protein